MRTATVLPGLRVRAALPLLALAVVACGDRGGEPIERAGDTAAGGDGPSATDPVEAASGPAPAGLTAAAGWSEPHILASGTVARPTVAIDPERSVAYVTWIETVEDVSNVFLSAVPVRAGGTDAAAVPEAGVPADPSAPAASAGPPGAGEPVRVNDVPGDAAPHAQAPAQVAVGPDGDVYVVWQSTTEVEGRMYPASELRFARSEDGGRSFAPAVTVHAGTGAAVSSHSFHDVLAAPDGTVYVSWIDGERRDRYLADYPGKQARAPEQEIRVAASTDGGRSFSRPVVVDAGACPCCRTALAADPGGALLVAWRKLFAGDVRDIVVARSEQGAGSFGPPVRVADDGWVFPACPHAGPGLAVDAAGRVHAAWYTGKTGGQGLYYASTENPERGFGAAVPLSLDERMPPALVSLTPAPTGGVWIAWDDMRSQPPEIRLVRLQDGAGRDGAAGGPRPGEGVRIRGRYPDVAASGSLVAMAWLREETVRASVRSAAVTP